MQHYWQPMVFVLNYGQHITHKWCDYPVMYIQHGMCYCLHCERKLLTLGYSQWEILGISRNLPYFCLWKKCSWNRHVQHVEQLAASTMVPKKVQFMEILVGPKWPSLANFSMHTFYIRNFEACIITCDT